MVIALRRVPRDRDPNGHPAPGVDTVAIRTTAGTVAPFVRRWPPLGLGERRPPVARRLREALDAPRESRIVLRALNLR